jgi:8-oxo-dGTP pyrophosphatase MutT (NUDIX family)
MRFTPHVTVATIIENHGRFLLVEEISAGSTVFNQPAGHLEADESLIQAAVRETLEETGWDVEITALIGIYLYTAASNGVTYQRICFAGKAMRHHPALALDDGIIAAHWLTRDELAAQPERWRSELVMQCLDDYLSGERFSLDLLRPASGSAQ